MILKYLVNRVSIAALVMILCVAGSSAAAASSKPRPVVLSTNPLNGAVDVDVQTSITVNFSLPMKCGSINKHTFRLKPVGFGDIAAGSITCCGSSATFTPTRGLAVSTRYKMYFVGAVKAANGKTLKDGFSSDFTTVRTPDLRPPRRQPQPPLRLRRPPRPRLRPQPPLTPTRPPRLLRPQLQRLQARPPPTLRPRRRPQLRPIRRRQATATRDRDCDHIRATATANCDRY